MGWNYRRWILEELAAAITPDWDDQEARFPSSLSSSTMPDHVRKTQLELAENELRYTLRKIESNFSNFSAWHQRSKLLPCIWDAKRLDQKQRMMERDKDADRQTLEQQIQWIEELAELEPDSKLCADQLDAAAKATLDKQIKNLLERLSHIDPLRQRRYEDLLKPDHTY
ncbi:protein geranylgeranyltransferase type II [Malassezia equina]|uniref:Geranylgeranyl transferase type-2 subunit alpha n=1 Tax=Malassezia equina TaxID=1381935 RepID=A0AAF0EBW8_9BASI|nr:protein geranylgeranyltransferase type II [Malassezia equina]